MKGKKAFGKVCLGLCQTQNVKKKKMFERIDESLPGSASLTKQSRCTAACGIFPGPSLLNSTTEQPGTASPVWCLGCFLSLSFHLKDHFLGRKGG